MADDDTFSLPQALRAQKAMRDALGLDEERFPVPAFVGMVSDEIEQLRARGQSDEAIAELIHKASGCRIDPVDLARYYATPGDRHPHD